MLRRISRLLISLILILSFVLSTGYASNIDFTPEELDYIQHIGEVTVCVDPDWPPFEWINEKGEHEGIAADLLKLISQRTGIRFKLLQTKSWDESLDMSKAGDCKILDFLNQTPKREEWLIFSEPVFIDPNVFVTREEHPYIADLNYLSNEVMVFPKGTAMEELIRRKYPNIKIVITESEQEAFRMVSEKKADITMRSLFMAAYTIKKEGLFNLKISGQLNEYTNLLRIGIQKDDTMLREILNRGIRTITPEEKWQIINRHISINVQTGTDYRLLYEFIVVFILFAIFAGYWNYQLKKHNKELIRIAQMDALTNIYNRKKLDDDLIRESIRAKRDQLPFSIILIDIDNFKKVNDEWGHLVRDSLIKQVTQILIKEVRPSDIVGRWGGEEFLVLCPETEKVAAINLAERIRTAIETRCFTTKRQQTISLGVASLIEEDSIESLLQRADVFLYQAKQKGKNQVCYEVSSGRI